MAARRTAGVILAGGRSRRMGREKPLVEIGGLPLIARVAAAVTACVDETLVVTNNPAMYAFLGLPMVPDAYADRGPLAGILAGMTHQRCEAALVVAGDYPFLEPSALRRILREDPEGGIVVPEVGGRLQPLCALYGRECAGLLAEALESGDLAVLSFVARLRRKVLVESALGEKDAARTYFNVNTPEDVRRAEDLLAQTHARE